jgi:tetratricopeptide (TPR) repeat protein
LERAHTLQLSGLLKRDLNRKEAEQDLQEAIQIMLSQGDLASAANVLSNLAQFSLWWGKIDQGFAYLDEEIEIYERLGNRDLIASALSFKSIKLLRYSTIEDARRTRMRALNLYREIQNDQFTAWSLWELGEIERVAGEVDAAMIHYEEARRIFQNIGDQLGLAFYYRGLGDANLTIGDPSSSLDYFQRSLSIAQDLHDWSVAYALGGCGRAFFALGQYKAAGAEFGKALKLDDEIDHIDLTMVFLADICRLLLIYNQEILAVELGSFVYQSHETWVETKNQVMDTIKLASKNLSDEQYTAAQERGREASRESIVERYLEELSSK